MGQLDTLGQIKEFEENYKLKFIKEKYPDNLDLQNAFKEGLDVYQEFYKQLIKEEAKIREEEKISIWKTYTKEQLLDYIAALNDELNFQDRHGNDTGWMVANEKLSKAREALYNKWYKED